MDEYKLNPEESISVFEPINAVDVIPRMIPRDAMVFLEECERRKVDINIELKEGQCVIEAVGSMSYFNKNGNAGIIEKLVTMGSDITKYTKREKNKFSYLGDKQIWMTIFDNQMDSFRGDQKGFECVLKKFLTLNQSQIDYYTYDSNGNRFREFGEIVDHGVDAFDSGLVDGGIRWDAVSFLPIEDAKKIICKALPGVGTTKISMNGLNFLIQESKNDSDLKKVLDSEIIKGLASIGEMSTDYRRSYAIDKYMRSALRYLIEIGGLDHKDIDGKKIEQKIGVSICKEYNHAIDLVEKLYENKVFKLDEYLKEWNKQNEAPENSFFDLHSEVLVKKWIDSGTAKEIRVVDVENLFWAADLMVLLTENKLLDVNEILKLMRIKINEMIAKKEESGLSGWESSLLEKLKESGLKIENLALKSDIITEQRNKRITL
jgi:hypothetical protein